MSVVDCCIGTVGCAFMSVFGALFMGAMGVMISEPLAHWLLIL